MFKQALKKSQLYVNYLGPSSALLGNLIATPILISNLSLKQWSLFALVSILLPVVYLILFGSSEIVRRLMINIFLVNEKTEKSINMFYKYEKKILSRFIPAIIFLSLALILFNSNSYKYYEKIELTFLFISIAVLIKMFEFYYAELLNGLKQHYKLHICAFVITITKWSSIIYLSFGKEVNIDTLFITMIIFSLLMIIIQRLFILNFFKEKQNQLKIPNKAIISKFNENNFGIVIFLFLLLQHFNKVLAFGILDPVSLSYFGIAFMLSTAIPLIITPIIVYLTPEIYEAVEINTKSRKKNFSKLIILQFFILFIPLVLVNLNIEQILITWLGKNVYSVEISAFLIPLSITTLSISLLNSLKILFIAENKISFMKKPLIVTFCFFISLTIIIYLKIINVEIYLYCLAISMFFLMVYFYIIFFTKKNY